ncbi:MAG: TonB-dependent receptor [Bryobacterales bacterium]|nr:TonB-dependent receptor [Bryobacterales bacterium]
MTPIFSRGGWRPLLTAAWMLALAASLSVAQEITGTLTGTTSDASGAVLPGVSITVTNKDSNQSLTARSDSAGVWYARELKPGRYSVKLEAKGFQTTNIAEVIVPVGRTITINNSLTIGAVEQSVTVTEAPPVIDFTGTTVAQNLTAAEIDRIPKGRSFQSVILLAPFTNSGDIEGGYQVNGASGAENNFMVDGLSTTSLVNGKSRQNAAFEYIQEVQVKTNGIEAEYGGALGGVVNAVTKSGGNQFHGEAHYFLFGNKLSASPVKRLLLDPIDDRTVSYVQDSKFKNDTHEFGGSLGGYLIKNKLYFYTAISPQFQRSANDYLFANGLEADTIERKRLFMNAFNKLSFDPSNRVRTNFSWLYSPFYSEGTLPGYDSYANAVSANRASNQANKTRGFSNPQASYSGDVNIQLSNTSLLSLRGGYFFDNFRTNGVPAFSSVTYQTSGIGLPFDIPANLRQGVNAQNTPRVQQTFKDAVGRTYLRADYSVFANFLGQHNLKVGAGHQRNVNSVDVGYPGGGYVFIWWDRAFRSNATGVTDRGQYGYYEVNDIGTRGSVGAGITHLYIQDQWRVSKKLSLSLGLRTENEKIPSFRRAQREYAFEFPFEKKLAPRLGASYDVFGDGRMKVYGSWGLFYDWTKYELARGSFGGDFWTVKYRALDTLDVFNLSGTNAPGRDIWNPAVPNSFRDRRLVDFNAVDPDLKPMSQSNTSLGFEYAVKPQMVMAVRYVHNSLRRTIEDLGTLVDGNETYIFGNPGEGISKVMIPSTATQPFAMPKPKRTYDGVEFSVSRRFSNRWFGQASYVYSRLYGNYAGLANSDEISSPTTNRTSATSQQSAGSIARQGGNANRSWDLDEILFDSKGNIVEGRLGTDRPHVMKFFGSYNFKFGTELGGFFYAGSGTPITTNYQTQNGVGVFANGRGDLGRSPVFNQTDLMVAHEFKMGEVRRLRLEFNMQNLFNQKTARSIYPSINRERRQSAAIDLHSVDLTKGYDPAALLAATTDGRALSLAPQFGKADIFNPGFAGRFLLKYVF